VLICDEQPPEFQLVPLPKTNPILDGERWKQYHYALGKATKDMPAESWLFVEKEKSPDMIHVLQFPYSEFLISSISDYLCFV